MDAAAAHQAKADAERDQAEGVKQRKPFAAVIQEHRHGALHAELSESLADVVRAVREENKHGEITLKLRVGPGPTPGTVVLSPTVTAKRPEPPLEAAIFYDDDEGNLSREDPRQMAMGIVADAGGRVTG